MKKILGLSLIAIALVGTSLLADESSKYPHNKNLEHHGQFQNFNQKRDMDMPPKRPNESIFGLLNLFHLLNLTSDQQKKIHQIVQDNQKNRPHIYDAFKDKGFDKNRFIEIRRAQKDAKIEVDAEIIEKTYSLLTTEQKNQFKTILDMQKIIMQKRMKYKGFINDKNSNGRR